MAKLSEDEEKERREEKIFGQFDRILKRLEKAYREDNEEDVRIQMIWMIAFQRGVYCSLGKVMAHKLNKRLDDWYMNHRELIRKYGSARRMIK